MGRARARQRLTPAPANAPNQTPPLIRLLAILALLTHAALVRGAVLVGLDEFWRYSNATATNAAPFQGWFQPDYPDTAWRNGRSGFGTTSYGEQTWIDRLPGDWRTVLFRKSFVVPDTNGLGPVVLRIDYRDAFVAYLNGREIARRGLDGAPDTPVPFDLVPPPRYPGSAEHIRLGPAAQLLRPGTNVLAIQVHSDSDFERPALVPELVTDFLRGPYLQFSGTNTMTVLWRTADPLPARIRFGPENSPATNTVDLPAGTNHAFRIPNLEPGTRYRYSVATLHPDGTESVSGPFPFRATAASGPVRIAVFGDSGAGSSGQFAVARAVAASGADLVLHAGDVIYPAFVPDLADTRLLSVYRNQMATTPFAFAWGNHDLYYGSSHMRAVIEPPTNSEPAEVHRAEGTHPEAYYSFDIGDVHVAVIYQTILSQYAFRTNSAQYRWLDADLAATRKPWKIAIAHHPIATSGGHRFTDYNQNGLPDWQEYAEVLVPLLNRHSVQLYISGHDHTFERFLPRNGLHPVVTGGGGTHLYFLRGWDSASAQLHIIHHFTQLDFNGNTLDIRAQLPDGRLLDRFQIQRAPEPDVLRTAAWATPRVEPPGPNNADGNIVGQTYDLASAPPLRALTGRTANLGNARVALDKSHLHLGLDAVMAPPDTDVIAFLEIPGLPGVDSLAGLGNGFPDPAGEGADALDAFENLRFNGFRPALAIVLGDEYADATDRTFRRPAQTSGLGQGVFRLEPGFPSLAGARLQQFNRSPQDTTVAPEQNADFIEVSLPRSALGTLAASGTIRLALIAAGPPDLLRQTRPVDSGHLGSSLNVLPDGTATLAAVAVRLPEDPDPDDDGLTDAEELALGTDPLQTDTDGDSLPDGWEVRSGLDPKSATGAQGGLGDPDADGFGNLTEFRLGSDPRNSSQPEFRLGASRLPAGRIALEWVVPAGGALLERAATPAGPWEAHEGFPREPGSLRDRIELTPGTGEAFFRLRRP